MRKKPPPQDAASPHDDNLESKIELVLDEDAEPGDVTGALAELLLDLVERDEQPRQAPDPSPPQAEQNDGTSGRAG